MMHRSFSGSPFAGPSREFMTLPALDSVVVPLAMRVRWKGQCERQAAILTSVRAALGSDPA